MIKFKVCPRCRGDLYLNEDIFGKYFNCLQCGYQKDAQVADAVKNRPLKKRKAKPPVNAGQEAA